MAQVSPFANNRSSDQQVRLNEIQTSLQQVCSVSVKELSNRLCVSLVTIRRDLYELEAQSRLRRTHGGAVSIVPLFYKPFGNDLSFQTQVEKFADVKRRIGRAAAALVKEGEAIGLTPGTTTTEVMHGLPLNQKNKVVTSAVNIAMELSNRKDLDVFVIGGRLHRDGFRLLDRQLFRASLN
jgi:DeoR/GlpR family transcriptional regulator of sugar metabolism